MTRLANKRYVSSAQDKGESKRKQQDGAVTGHLAATHVPLGYENRSKAVYVADGAVYEAYHVPSGEIHLLPRGDGTEHRLEEFEAGDVEVIA